ADLGPFEHAVAAVRANTGATVPARRRLFLTVEAAAVTGDVVAVVTGLGPFARAIAAADALFALDAQVVLVDLRAVGATAVAVLVVAVVAEFVVVDDAIAAELAGRARHRTDPVAALQLAHVVAAVHDVGVAVITLLAALHHAVATLEARRALDLATPLGTFDLARRAATVTRLVVTVVALLVVVELAVAARRVFRRRTAGTSRLFPARTVPVDVDRVLATRRGRRRRAAAGRCTSHALVLERRGPATGKRQSDAGDRKEELGGGEETWDDDVH